MDSWVLHYWHSLKLWFKEFSLDRALSPTVVAVGSSANCNYHLYAVKLLVLLLLLFSPCNFTQQLYDLLLLTLNCQNQFCTLTPCFYISFHLTQPGGEIFSLKKKGQGLRSSFRVVVNTPKKLLRVRGKTSRVTLFEVLSFFQSGDFSVTECYINVHLVRMRVVQGEEKCEVRLESVFHWSFSEAFLRREGKPFRALCRKMMLRINSSTQRNRGESCVEHWLCW